MNYEQLSIQQKITAKGNAMAFYHWYASGIMRRVRNADGDLFGVPGEEKL